MIEFLHIENVAVVKSLDIEFKNGMTALTGETGAGKSIIIDSLNLLSGARADRELIRTGESKAEVSAVFSQIRTEVAERLDDMGIETDEGRIILSRALNSSGSTARINGRPITLAVLREVAAMLFGIHGQNDNMLLLDPKNHVRILDTYAGNKSAADEYSRLYREVLRLKMDLSSLSEDAMEQNRMTEMLRYQIEDIDSVRPKENEEEELEANAARLRSAEKIEKCCALVEKALNGSKGAGAIYLTERAASAMESVVDALPEAEAIAARLTEVRYELEDIASSMAGLSDIGEGDVTARLDKIEARLSAIAKLKRKYGSTVKEILEFRRNAAERLSLIDNIEDRRAELEDELSVALQRANDAAKALSDARKEAARGLSKNVCETLAFLDMPKVRFEVSVERARELNAFGCDSVEFMISANVGEPLMPMARIASGGELARIMLSLKNVINACDGIDTVIFDEIDTGISGKTSRKVGIKLKEIGREAQVICVTHSAQIASLAHNHLYVSKREVDGRTQSSLRLLDDDERTAEIARILGGIEITGTQLAAAVEMIAEGKKY